MHHKESMMLNIELIKKGQNKMDESYITEASSVLKRRKTKLTKNKNAEQIIYESYEELIQYIDSLDSRVQEIVKTYEIQFLQAYNFHIKKVKSEMQELRNNSLNNVNSEKALQQKVDSLQKQLRIFREQSLKLFDKVTSKDKQINNLNSKIKSLQKDNKQYEKNIYFLTKRTKDLDVFYQRNKHHQISIKEADQDHQLANQHQQNIVENRPFTTHYRTKSYYAHQKKNSIVQFGEDKSNNNPLTLNHDKFSTSKDRNRFLLNQTPVSMDHSEKLVTPSREMKQHQSKRKVSLKFDNNLKMKSFQFSEREKYIKIFRDCVEEVRSQINKKQKVVSLNFFKQHGPKNYVQFRKQDFNILLQLLLKNEDILMQFYKMIFSKQAQI